MNLDEFCLGLSADMASLLRKIIFIRMIDGELPVRILQVPVDPSKPFPVAITFHGARTEGAPYPMFYGNDFAENGASDKLLIALADPTLEISSELRFGWYCGHEHFNVPRAINTFLHAIIATLTPSRMVFFGGSIGAHPALRCAKEFPNSVAILVNPIIKISAYYDVAVRPFLEKCWPNSFDSEHLTSEHVLDDAGAIFEGSFLESTIIVLQNATDPHLSRQAAPMIARLGSLGQPALKILPITPFLEDAIGHRMTPSEMFRCVEAAIRAKTTDVISIAAIWNALSQSKVAKDSSSRNSDRDIALANSLAAQVTEQVC